MEDDQKKAWTALLTKPINRYFGFRVIRTKRMSDYEKERDEKAEHYATINDEISLKIEDAFKNGADWGRVWEQDNRLVVEAHVRPQGMNK